MNVTTLTHTVRGALLSTGVLATAASLIAAQPCQILHTPQTIIPGAVASYAAADLNGDGKTDIVAVSYGNLEIYLSNGASFAAPVTVAAILTSVFTGDVNNDGRPDIVGVSTDNQHIVVFLNNGNGTFGPGHQYQAGLNPSEIAIGDLNGDGFADLAITLHGSTTLQDGQLAVLLNDGQGGFGQPQVYTTGLNPNGVVIADFNKDGYNDVAVVNYGYEYNNVSPYPGSAMIFEGSATGALILSQTVKLGPQAGLLTVGDFNGDGYPDLAINVINGNDQRPGVFTVLWNDQGRFDRVTNWPAQGYNAGISAGDFNQDGYVDLAVTSLDTGDVVIYFNDGNGEFVPSEKIFVPDGSANTVVGDFNGDGRLDLAAINVGNAAVTVFYNDETRPTVSLASAPNPSQTGSPVTLTANVSVPGWSGCGLEGGSVLFLDSGKPIHEPVPIDAEGNAVITDSGLAAGTHLLIALFKPAALSRVGKGVSKAVSQVVR